MGWKHALSCPVPMPEWQPQSGASAAEQKRGTKRFVGNRSSKYPLFKATARQHLRQKGGGGQGIGRNEKLANMRRTALIGNTPSHLGMLAAAYRRTQPAWFVTGKCLLDSLKDYVARISDAKNRCNDRPTSWAKQGKKCCIVSGAGTPPVGRSLWPTAHHT